MLVRLVKTGLSLFVLLQVINCQSDGYDSIHGGQGLTEIDLASGDVIAEPMVKFKDGHEPTYADNELFFTVIAANDAAISYVYVLLHGENLSCDNATGWQPGSFDTVVTLNDINNDGDRLVCISGVDAQARISQVVVSRDLEKKAPQPAETTTLDVTVEKIEKDGKMTVKKKGDNSAAASIKWCVIAADDSCPTPDPQTGEFNDVKGICEFQAGALDTEIDIASGKTDGTKHKVCVVALNQDKSRQSLVDREFEKGEAAVAKPTTVTPAELASLPPNDGQLVTESHYNTHFYQMGYHICNFSPYFANTGTEAVTVKFDYLNDTGSNNERRINMFSDIVYKVFPTADYITVRNAMVNDYCRNGKTDGMTVLKQGDTFSLPANHRVIAILKTKNPYSMKHDAKYFNAKGYACIQMRLTDLNNDTSIDKYRCVRRAELELYSGKKSKDDKLKKLVPNGSGEYVIELSRNKKKTNHQGFTVVNATMAKAIAAGSNRAWAEQSHNQYFVWKLVGSEGANVPKWLYYLGENYTKTDVTPNKVVTGENEFQFGIRESKFTDSTMPAAGSSYKLRLLSNSLSDSDCQGNRPYTYTTKQDSLADEKRKDKIYRSHFCLHEDVLQIKIVK